VRTATAGGKAGIPVARSLFWLMMSMLAWEVYQGARAGVAPPASHWAIAPVDLVFLTLLPALCAFAFTRLFLVLTQNVRGSLNVYTVIASPYAWVFWIGMALGMMGHGIHLSAHAIQRSLPNIFIQGQFAAKINFLDTRIGYLMLGAGFFLATVIILLLGQGSSRRMSPAERALFVLGSLATYGVIFIYLGVGQGQIIAAIAGSLVISAIGFWLLPSREITHDLIAAFIVPGSFLACVTLVVWAIIVGGQPTWP